MFRKSYCLRSGVNQNPGWYSLIADEATDVNNREQLNLSIRYVDDDYVAHEDPISLLSLPNTFAETVYSVLKDLLLRCDLSLKLCRGQAYDGASVMQGNKSGVAIRELDKAFLKPFLFTVLLIL